MCVKQMQFSRVTGESNCRNKMKIPTIYWTISATTQQSKTFRCPPSWFIPTRLSLLSHYIDTESNLFLLGKNYCQNKKPNPTTGLLHRVTISSLCYATHLWKINQLKFKAPETIQGTYSWIGHQSKYVFVNYIVPTF